MDLLATWGRMWGLSWLLQVYMQCGGALEALKPQSAMMALFALGSLSGCTAPIIVTLRGAARGSSLETVPQHFSNPSTHFQIFPPIRSKSIPKLLQILPRPSQMLPKSSQILGKIDPKSIQKPSWNPFWINVLQKLDFERPRNGQEAPKSDQKTPQSVPTPSQMDPKTVPNPFLEHFFLSYFPIQKLHGFLMDF